MKRFFVMALCSMALAASAFAADTTAAANSNISASPISDRVQSAELWIADVIASLSSSGNGSSIPIPANSAVVVDKAIQGKFGGSAYESLKSISTYLRLLETRIKISSQVDQHAIDSIENTRAHVDAVVDSFSKFIEAREHRPKNDQDKIKYGKELEKQAASVLSTAVQQMDVEHSQNLFLEQRLNPLIAIDGGLQ